MLTTGLTDDTMTVTTLPTDSGGSSDSGLSDHDDTQAQSDLINDARANIAGYDQEYEADAGGDHTNVSVTDHDGGATNGGTTVIDPDTSDDATGDRVAISEGTNDAGQETTTIVDEQGNTTTADHADSASEPEAGVTGDPSDESTSSSVGAGTAAAALLVGAALVRGS